MPGGYTQHIGIDSPDGVYAGVDTSVYRPGNYMLGGGRRGTERASAGRSRLRKLKCDNLKMTRSFGNFTMIG